MYSEFSHLKWWFSIVLLVYQRVVVSISLRKNTQLYPIIEGSLEVQLPTIWTDEKQRWEESERREE